MFKGHAWAIRGKPAESALASLGPTVAKIALFLSHVEGLFGHALHFGYELSPSSKIIDLQFILTPRMNHNISWYHF